MGRWGEKNGEEIKREKSGKKVQGNEFQSKSGNCGVR